MTESAPSVRRVIADAAMMDVPEGLEARPTQPEDVEAVTALMRAVDIAGCGHTTSNLEWTEAALSDSATDWGYGSATLWRAGEAVGMLIIADGLVTGQGWSMDIFARPGDPKIHAINGALIDAGLREGRYRWDALYMDPEAPLPTSRAAIYANDGALRTDLEKRGFEEVRRYLQMKRDHWSVEGLTGGSQDSDPGAGSGAGPAQGYRIRQFRNTDEDWRAAHAVTSAAFADHFDYVALEFDEWRQHLVGGTEDFTQWWLAEHDGQVVGEAMGSNRYASEDYGYVSSIGVLREHRGNGVARALLEACIADDIERGFLGTILHVDATSPTGATHLYESVGMTTDSEYVDFHRGLFR